MDELTELALAGRDGDRMALAAFAAASYRDVWRLCAYLGGADIANDLTQEVYVRALRSLPRYRADATARTWLLGIASRTVADHIRTNIRRRRLGNADSGRAQEHDPTALVDLHALMATLTVERRKAFVLTQIVGLSYAEAAAICGCSIGTIRSRVARARTQLTHTIHEAEQPAGTCPISGSTPPERVRSDRI